MVLMGMVLGAVAGGAVARGLQKLLLMVLEVRMLLMLLVAGDVGRHGRDGDELVARGGRVLLRAQGRLQQPPLRRRSFHAGVNVMVAMFDNIRRFSPIFDCFRRQNLRFS
jgi:hypothetical protein